MYKRQSVCYGGGVAAIYGGTFIMDGGEIKNCFAESDYIDYYDPSRCYTAMGGGVFVSGGSSLVMNGGTVSNNNATNMGGGIAVVSAYEEVASGLGNLKSSAEILGGTIKNNNAKTGAGVLASAYYYAYANGICAPNPTVGSSAKQGLYIKNAQILDNIADTVDGYGGGIFVSMLRSPAVASIEDTTIQRNKASMGGGEMCIRDRKNPFDFSLSEVIENDSKTKVALSEEQEQALLDFIAQDNCYQRYYDDVLLSLIHI